MHIKNFDPFDFKKKIINGVPVYYKNIPWAPCVYLNVIFNGGAMKDPIGKEGLAHYTEHITVKGSPRIPDYKVWREWRKKYTFMTANAMTNYHSIFYPLKCLPKDFEKVSLDLKDMLLNCFLKEEDIESERNVILQEAWDRYENEKFLKFIKDTKKNIFKNHPYERFHSPLGWPDTIKKIVPDDVRNYYKENFVAENMTIILVGNINQKEVNFLKNFIKDFPNSKSKNIKEKKYKIEPPIKNLVKVSANSIGLEKKQVEISILRVLERQNEKQIAINILANNLLHEILNDKFRVEQNICYGVSINSSSNKYSSSIGMNITTEEKNIDNVLLEFKKIVNNFSTSMYKQKFEDTKTSVRERREIREYMSTDIIDQARNDLLKNGKIFSLKEGLDLMKKVEFKDLQKFIKDTFGDEKKVYTEIILSSKKEEKTKTKNAKK